MQAVKEGPMASLGEEVVEGWRSEEEPCGREFVEAALDSLWGEAVEQDLCWELGVVQGHVVP